MSDCEIGLAIVKKLASKVANIVLNGVGDSTEIEFIRAGIGKGFGFQCALPNQYLRARANRK